MLYLVGTNFVARFEEGYPVAYSCLAVALCLVMVGLWLSLPKEQRSKSKPHLRIWPGIIVGLAGIALWIGLCELDLERSIGQFLPKFLRPGERVGYNPFEELSTVGSAWTFIGFRLLGIALVVPIAEELFWRGFLLRWLIDPEWERVPIGEYTFASCMIVTLMFTLAHPEWLAAATYCLLINGLLYWKRDLWLCIVAHAVSNLALVVYVLNFEQWELW